MKKIVLDIQSDIHAHTMERMLMQKLDDCQVVISESPDATAEWCKTHRPDVLLMEVKAYSPWMFKERMAIRDKVKRNTENCRVILFVDDDTDGELTEKVRQAKVRYPKTILLRSSTVFKSGNTKRIKIFKTILREEMI